MNIQSTAGSVMQVNIQLLRFLAAMSVVIYHATPHYLAAGGTDNSVLHFIRLTFYGGVDVFFVISGYIMWVSTRNSSGLQDSAIFLYRRATRIYFGYWPYLLLLLLVLFFYDSGVDNKTDVTGSIFLTQHKHEKLLLPVSWSLTYELYFYVFFALLLLFTKSASGKLLGVILALSIITIFMVWCIDIEVLRKNFRWVLKASRFYLSPYIAEFISGCLLALYCEKRGKINLWLCAAAFSGFVATAVFYQVNKVSGADSLLDYPHARVAFFGPAAILLVAIFSEAERRGFVPFAKASLLLGGASYSLYLSHTILLNLFFLAGLRPVGGEAAYTPAFFFVSAVLLILAYSIWHYRYIESPLMRFSRRIIGKMENK